jgi:glycosyltransferase involved in cell wall biosynthesis
MEPSTHIIIVSGKDPLEGVGGGVSYVRSIGRAARSAGFTPEIFCAATVDDVVETPFGRVHRVRSPMRHLARHGPGMTFRSRLLPFHTRRIRSAIGGFLEGREGTFVVHSFGPWGSIGVRLAQRQLSPERTILPVVTMFTTVRHENAGKLSGVSSHHGVGARIAEWLEYPWMMATNRRHERLALRGSKRILVNYESVADEIRREGRHAPITILPYSSEAAFDDPPTPRSEPEALRRLRPSHAPLVVAVSRHDPRKGLDVLLHALAALRARDVPFRACLVGPGALLARHRRLMRRLELGDSTSIVGHAPDQIAYLQHADIFVLPSLEEGSGSIAMIEAMQAGLAIVASDIDGVPEDVTHGDTAELVASGDPDALSRGLERVLTDPAMRHRLQRRSRQVFEERFTAARFAESLGDLYRSMAPTENTPD